MSSTTGSFSRAADRAGLPKSTVSRRIAQLEAQLGERLLLRTTRKLTVTDFGADMLEHARSVLAEVEAVSALAQHRQAEPGGRLRVSMPNDIANVMLGPMLARFMISYPAITLEVDLSPRRVDLIGENFDVAIRMGSLPDDATLAARQLAVFSNSLYASPAYLQKRGMPATPQDLMAHDTLRLLTRSGEPVKLAAEPRRATLGRPAARPGHRQLARGAAAAGLRRRRHRGAGGPFRRPLPARRAAGAGAAGLDRAGPYGLCGVSGQAVDAQPHPGVPGRDGGGVFRAEMRGGAGAAGAWEEARAAGRPGSGLSRRRTGAAEKGLATRGGDGRFHALQNARERC